MSIKTSSAGWGLAVVLLLLGGCGRSPDATRNRHLERGKRLFASKDYARALLEFRNAAKAMPRDAEVHYQIGMAAAATGDPRMAVRAFKQAVDLNPKQQGAQLKLAELMATAGDPAVLEEAQKYLKALLETSPDNAEALNILAVTELKLGHMEGAIQSLEQALTSAPQQLSASLMLALTRLAQKDIEGAEKVLHEACDRAPKAALPRVLLGRFYYDQKQFAGAEAEYRRALAIDPNSREALLDLVRLLRASGRRQEAEQNIKRLANSGDKNYAPLHALFLFEEGRREEAVRELEELARKDPKDRLTRTRLVAAYQAMNRQADAERVLADALKKNPKDLDALLQRAELLVAAGNHQQAEISLNQVLSFNPNSAEVRYVVARLQKARGATLTSKQQLSEAVSLNPHFLPARLELVQVLLANKEAKAALDLLNQTPDAQKRLIAVVEQRNWALLAAGDIPEARKGIEDGLARNRTPDLLMQDALLKVANRRYAEARKSIREALANAPEDLRLLQILVRSYAAEKQLPAAVKEVEAYAAQRPKSAAVQYFLGNLFLQAGNRGQAQQVFAAAKAASPDYVPVELALAQMDLTEAKWDSARQTLTGLLSTRRENATARLWLGMLEESVGNHSAAILHFRKTLESAPDNFLALNNLAYLLAEHTNQADEALKHAQRAKELAPDHPDVEDTLGWVLFRKGVYEPAITHLKAAVAKGKDPRYRYHLAMAYLKAGDESRGRATLESALKVNPNVPEAKAAQQIVEGQGGKR